MLEVKARGEVIRKLIGTGELEHISGIEIQIAVAPIDVLVRIIEVVRRRTVQEGGREHALCALHSEACQHLPLAAQTFHRGEFNSVVSIVVQFGDVGHHEVTRAYVSRVSYREKGQWLPVQG